MCETTSFSSFFHQLCLGCFSFLSDAGNEAVRSSKKNVRRKAKDLPWLNEDLHRLCRKKKKNTACLRNGKNPRNLNCITSTNIYVIHSAISSSSPNKISSPAFLIMNRPASFRATANPVPVSLLFLTPSFTTAQKSTPLLILPTLSVVSFLSASTVLLVLMCPSLSMMWPLTCLSSNAPVMKSSLVSANLKQICGRGRWYH